MSEKESEVKKQIHNLACSVCSLFRSYWELYKGFGYTCVKVDLYPPGFLRNEEEKNYYREVLTDKLGHLDLSEDGFWYKSTKSW